MRFNRPALYVATAVIGIGLLVAGVSAGTVFVIALVVFMLVMHMGGHGHGGHGGGRRSDPEGELPGPQVVTDDHRGRSGPR